ncbi:GWxTD domain-containing protein [bacterium]|nr:GWxTD domain-containing protein [bacterium]
MRSTIRFWMNITGAVLILCGMAFGQLPEMQFKSAQDVPDFFYDMMTVASQDSGLTTFRFFSKIAYDELQFLREDNRYHARYELSVTVFDQHGDQADGRIVQREIWVDSYEETNSRLNFDVAEVSFDLKPAVYELLVGLMDFDSRKTGRRKTRLTVPEYGKDQLEISGIMLADRVLPDSTGRLRGVPNVIGNFADQQESLFLWFEVYDHLGLDSVRVQTRIFSLGGDLIRTAADFYPLEGERTELVIHIPREELGAGRYKLEICIGKGKTAICKVRELTVHWMGMPAYANDLDKAIEQMKYIASGKETKAMKKARGEEKTRLFREFWKEKDPTPATEENEIMEEYYRRVDYANTTFGTFHEGWRSDRGMVYIILGAPNDIERHPFEVDSKPYEIWSYYQYNRQFIFVDQSGFGDYHLISPFWEVLNEIR